MRKPGDRGFSNVYDDPTRASSYALLEFPGTYYLAFRDLPELIARHVRGTRALDFGCGTGRSTRFLKRLGFDAVGIDISSSMIELARAADPTGEYLKVSNGDFAGVADASFDLVLSAFAFDNIPHESERIELFRGIRQRLGRNGRLILLGSTPEIYTHEWASFTTAAFPENLSAISGDPVRIVTKDVPDGRPVVDLLWLDSDYRNQFLEAGLEVIQEHRPLGKSDEAPRWISEIAIAPWVIYVVRPDADPEQRLRPNPRAA